MSRATVLPVRLRVVDESLRCEVQRIVGYRATCPCGFKGDYRTDYALARADSHAHNRGQHS